MTRGMATDRRPLTFGAKVSVIPHLADALGYFRDEGLQATLLSKPEIKAAAARGERLDAQVDWYHHCMFSAAAGQPLVAVMVLNDAPGITVMVPNRLKDEIHTGADFAGRNVAEGASRSAKGITTNYLAVRHGLAPGSYTPVLTELVGRREAVLRGLASGSVDVLTFMEPMTSVLLETGEVSTIYDLTTRASTTAVFGAPWPAECLMVPRALLDDEPQTVRCLVNVFLRTMRFVDTHSPAEILDMMPAGYLAGSGREAVAAAIAHRRPTMARGDYRMPDGSAELMLAAARCAPFDDTASGRNRARVAQVDVDPDATYTNTLVDAATAAAP
jgi:NitT/TauT family transport system substrate-binding protein